MAAQETRKRIRGRMQKRREFAPVESAAVRGKLKPPEPFDWQTYGRANQVLAGRHGVGHETPGTFADWMRANGERDGAVRQEDERTVADGAPPTEIPRRAGEVRIGLANEDLLRTTAPLEKYIKQAAGLIKRAHANVVVSGKKLEQQEEELPVIRTKLAPKEKIRDEYKHKIEALPFWRRGVVRHWGIVAFVLMAVGTFDAAVLHTVLKQSALDTVSIWLTTVSVALVFAAINEPFGRLAAVIGLAVPGRHRMKLAGLVMVTGMLSLLVSIVMLGIFRHLAAVQQNQSLSDIAAGNDASLSFIVDPSFLAPLQICACAAAMLVVALYTLGKDSAALRQQLAEAEHDVDIVEAEIKTKEAEIEQTRGEIRASVLEVFQIEANAAGAEADIISLTNEFKALVNTETALAREMAEIYKAERNYYEAMFANGGIWRMALPTVYSYFNRPKDLAPAHGASDENTIKQRRLQPRPRRRGPISTNGKPDHKVDSEHLAPYR